MSDVAVVLEEVIAEEPPQTPPVSSTPLPPPPVQSLSAALDDLDEDSEDSTSPGRHHCKRGCSLRFTSIITRAHHYMSEHPDWNRVACAVCSRVLARNVITLHMREHDRARPYPCTMCDKFFFLSDASRKQHMQKMHPKKRRREVEWYNCKTCHKSLPIFSIKRHMFQHDPTNRPYPCTVCGVSFFTSKQMLYLHKIEMHTTAGDEGLTVEETAGETVRETQRSRTPSSSASAVSWWEPGAASTKKMKRKPREMMIPCEVCDQSIDKRYMTAHMKCHDQSRPHQCTICNVAYFPSKQMLARHKQAWHSANSLAIQAARAPPSTPPRRTRETRTYKCSLCPIEPVTFPVVRLLMVHQRHHHGFGNHSGNHSISD